tara:strand:+ start:1047 stop:1271 length:225 start_codon:yes stop_codon:yes gene_type:complete
MLDNAFCLQVTPHVAAILRASPSPSHPDYYPRLAALGPSGAVKGQKEAERRNRYLLSLSYHIHQDEVGKRMIII